jgi:hypothetical protein
LGALSVLLSVAAILWVFPLRVKIGQRIYFAGRGSHLELAWTKDQFFSGAYTLKSTPSGVSWAAQRIPGLGYGELMFGTHSVSIGYSDE